jgi:hypothetical protein
MKISVDVNTIEDCDRLIAMLEAAKKDMLVRERDLAPLLDPPPPLKDPQEQHDAS